MKIAIIHNLLSGGSKRVLQEQVKSLACKHTLSLFTLSTTDETFCSLLPYVQKHIKIPFTLRQGFPYYYISLYKDLPYAYRLMAKKIEEGRFDVAFVSACYLIQAPFILRFLTIPSVYYCPETLREFSETIPRMSKRFSYLFHKPFRLPLKWIDKENIHAATTILANSFYTKRRILDVYGLQSKVNYPGIDTRFFHPKEIKKEHAVLTVGNLSLLKGHDFLIRSIAKIPYPLRPKLVILESGGEEQEYLRTLAKRLEVVVELKDRVSDGMLVNWYSRAKVFAFTGVQEPFGMVLLEAISCGLPVIAVNEGGVNEALLQGKLGVLVERNEEKYSKELQKVLIRKSTKEEIESKRKILRNKWSWDKSTKELEVYLKKAGKSKK